MKIRNGFVTNSSSSSFVLSFENEESIKETLLKESTQGYFETIYKDIMNAKRLTKEEVLEDYRDDMYFSVKWALEEFLHNRKGMSYKQIYEFEETQEYKDMFEKELKSKVNILAEAIGNNPVIVEVKYDDHCNSMLEHEIMPYLSCCAMRISHH